MRRSVRWVSFFESWRKRDETLALGARNEAQKLLVGRSGGWFGADRHFRFEAIEEHRHRNAEKARDLEQFAGTDAICAVLVFLDLLKSDPDRTGKVGLRCASQCSLNTDSLSDLDIEIDDTAHRAALFHFAFQHRTVRNRFFPVRGRSHYSIGLGAARTGELPTVPQLSFSFTTMVGTCPQHFGPIPMLRDLWRRAAREAPTP